MATEGTNTPETNLSIQNLVTGADADVSAFEMSPRNERLVTSVSATYHDISMN